MFSSPLMPSHCAVAVVTSEDEWIGSASRLHAHCLQSSTEIPDLHRCLKMGQCRHVEAREDRSSVEGGRAIGKGRKAFSRGFGLLSRCRLMRIPATGAARNDRDRIGRNQLSRYCASAKTDPYTKCFPKILWFRRGQSADRATARGASFGQSVELGSSLTDLE